MKIGYLLFDTETKLCGINRLAKGFLRELADDKEVDINILGYDYYNIHNFPSKPALYSNNDSANRLCELKVQLDASDYQIAHSFFYPLPKCDKMKTIITINDLIALVNMEWFTNGEKRRILYDKYIREGAENADCIIAISEYTKKDIVNIFDISPEKIKVVYSGLYQTYPSLDESKWNFVKTKFLITKPFVLSICTIEPRKNLLSLIKAYENMRTRNRELDYQLVLVGRRGWKNERIYEHAANSPFTEDIIFTDYINDEELELLYANAMAFAYVSLYEGFGLPIIEAMAKGNAVLTSNVTSLPEVGGDAVCYCDPLEIESIEAGLEKIITDEQYRSQLQEKALERVKLFSYKNMVRNTIDIYKSLLN